MKAQVRPLGEDEPRDGVSKLLIAANPNFPEVRHTDFHEEFYRWYWEKHPLGDQLYRWVAVTEEGEVVGHLSGFPQCYRINGRRVIAHTPGDYAVLPGYGFYGFTLMRAYFRAVENTVACDMVPAVIRLETRMGAEVTGELSYAAKLLDVSRLPLPPVPTRVRRLLNLPEAPTASARGYDEPPERAHEPVEEESVEPIERRRLPLPAPAKKALNRALEAVDGALTGRCARGVETEEIVSFDDSFDKLFEKVAAIVPCAVERGSEFLNWRYGPDSPQGPVKVLGVRGGRGLLGYAVLKVASFSSEDGYILDLTTVPGHRDVARALLRESVRHFRQEGAHIIRYRFVESPSSPDAEDLRRLGFFHRKGRSNKLLVKLADPALHGVARDLENWSYTTGDGEGTFFLK